MKIELMEIKIKDLALNYVDKGEDGVFGYDGKLNIRPPYQREFVYKDKQRNAVIDSVMKERPLNVMYWSKNDDGTFEVIDGQQRTISICQYKNGDYPVEYRFYQNLSDDEKKTFDDYKILVYICEGTDKEKLEWFKTINIAGEKLTEQELRNAAYRGSFIADAKLIFSKINCPAYNLSKDYVKGSTIRQDFLETALTWAADKDSIVIEEYMGKHQHDKDASALWGYFQDVINWVKKVFPTVRKEMKGLEWGILYNKYNSKTYNPNDLEDEIKRLLVDDDVTKKTGIYEYLLSGNPKTLNIRAFTESQKSQKFAEQNGVCPLCNKTFTIDQMEADHITPWSEGGKTELSNCQMLCKECNRTKSNK